MSQIYCEKAISEAKVDGNRNRIAMVHHNMALRHAKFGFHELAEKELLTALDYCNPSAEFTQWGINYLLGIIYTQMNKLDLAERILNDIEEQLNMKSSSRHLLISYALSMVYIKQLNFAKAIPRLKQLYVSLKNIKGPSELKTPMLFIEAGLSLCESFVGLGNYYEALRYFGDVEDDIESFGNPFRLKLQAMIIKSAIMEKAGKDPMIPLLEAISSLEEIRLTAVNSTDHVYWERMLTIYDKAIETIYETGNYKQALQIAEKARSRRFLDYLGNKRLGTTSTQGFALTQQADAMLESLSLIEREMLDSAKMSGIKLRSVYHEETRYSKRLKKCQETLEEARRIDRRVGIAYNIVPIPPSEILQKLPGNLTIIEYYLTDYALYSWVISHESINALKAEVTREEIRDYIMGFRNSISRGAIGRGIKETELGSRKDFLKYGNELYRILITRAEEHVKTKKIVIVPYGILNYIPFQALYDGNRYLIEKYAISYTPSLSVFELLIGTKKTHTDKILAFGNPDLKDQELDLPAAEQEVDMIKTVFPSATIFKGEESTEARAKRLAGQYNIIHFASHGEYNPESPLSSCIRLSPGNGEDGRLEATEVFDMDIDAELVVTSACKTAIGKINKGDEIVGLTRAFLYAGSNSVFGSLWNISDEATAVLMKAFYQNIKHFEKAEALQRAQLDLINSKKYSHPFYWAAFNITGSF